MIEKQVYELCQKVQQGMEDGSVSRRQAGQWIFEQSKVRRNSVFHYHVRLTAVTLSILRAPSIYSSFTFSYCSLVLSTVLVYASSVIGVL